MNTNQIDWLPIESAPKDGTLILGLCKHDADIYHDESTDLLTPYASHCEGFSHVKDGPHVVQWGGWWFQYGSYYEVVANPTHWSPIPKF